MTTLKTELQQLDPTPSSEPALAVLIVDDDELIRMHLRLALSNEGLAISEASDASQALHLAATNHFDIILMDVRMPGLDGFSACEELKKLPGHGSTPVVMLTGMDDQESVQRASEVGAVDYMNKPLNTSAACIKFGSEQGCIFGPTCPYLHQSPEGRKCQGWAEGR